MRPNTLLSASNVTLPIGSPHNAHGTLDYTAARPNREENLIGKKGSTIRKRNHVNLVLCVSVSCSITVPCGSGELDQI